MNNLYYMIADHCGRYQTSNENIIYYMYDV